MNVKQHEEADELRKEIDELEASLSAMKNNVMAGLGERVYITKWSGVKVAIPDSIRVAIGLLVTSTIEAEVLALEKKYAEL